MSESIVVKGVTKTFGQKVAVRDLDLTLRSGEMVGLIGPNGAGKTTAIRMIMSILFPDRATISVLGHASALEAKDRIGYLPEERGVYKKMKVGAFLRYIGPAEGVDAGCGSERPSVRGWLERIGSRRRREARSATSSPRACSRRSSSSACVIHEPDLLILDEPFSGLDPVNMRLLRKLILEQHRSAAPRSSSPPT